MNNRADELIFKYWGKTELGRLMIISSSVSYYDLLFLIPNNVKRRYGIPATRTCGKRKSRIKQRRKHRILSFKCFDLISAMIEEALPKTIRDNVNSFVDVKDIAKQDPEMFQVTPRIDVAIPQNLNSPYFRVQI